MLSSAEFCVESNPRTDWVLCPMTGKSCMRVVVDKSLSSWLWLMVYSTHLAIFPLKKEVDERLRVDAGGENVRH